MNVMMEKRKLYLKKVAALLSGVCMFGTVIAVSGGQILAAKAKAVPVFSKSISKMQVGESFRFHIKGIQNKKKKIQWKSSNPSVLKVSKMGLVTAKEPGTAFIKATVKKTGKSVRCKVTVTPVPPKQEEEINLPKQDIVYDSMDEMTGTEDNYHEKEVENNLVKRLDHSAQGKDTVIDAVEGEDYSAINTFSYQLFQETMRTDAANPVISPLSAYYALALAADGAARNTKKQFQALLSENPCNAIGMLRKELETGQTEGSDILSIANSAWLDDDFIPNQAWLDHLSGFQHHAGIFHADLSSDAARNSINNWVCNQTRGMIPTLFDQNLSEDARLALINTIYLKARWAAEFSKYTTDKREFTNENKNKKETDFMNQTDFMQYFKNDQAEGILKYYNGGTAFLAIRPQGGQTARELAQNLTAGEIEGYIKQAKEKSTYVSLHLPKFTVEYNFSMNDSLSALGLTDAFDPYKADFTNIGTSATGGNLYISDVLQKIKVAVDEEGTEAAAVTAIVMDCASAIVDLPEPVDVSFDEPFIYIILDPNVQTGNKGETACIPLFMGMVTEF